jgi:hypothetical protein
MISYSKARQNLLCTFHPYTTTGKSAMLGGIACFFQARPLRKIVFHGALPVTRAGQSDKPGDHAGGATLYHALTFIIVIRVRGSSSRMGILRLRLETETQTIHLKWPEMQYFNILCQDALLLGGLSSHGCP